MLKIITKTKYTSNNNCMNQNINDKNISNIKSKNNINKLLIFLIFIFGMGLNKNLLGASTYFIEDEIRKVLCEKMSQFPDTAFKTGIVNELDECIGIIKKYREDKDVIQVGGRNRIFSELNSREKGKVLARSFTGLIGRVKTTELSDKIEYILGGLQNGGKGDVINNRILSLELIRILCDLEQEADSGILKTNDDPKSLIDLFKLTNQIFYHSRRLLNVIVIPDIARFYGISYMKLKDQLAIVMGDLLVNENRDTPAQGRSITQYFSINSKELQSIFTKKTEGIHFGAMIKVEGTEDFPARRFFLKAYHGYPAIESKNSDDTAIDTSKMVRSTGGQDTTTITIEKLDLKEPFIYKFFSDVKLGPNVVFTINPYINNGFFIFTEDLSDESILQSFFEASKFKGPTEDIGFVENLRTTKIFLKERAGIDIDNQIFKEELYKKIFIDATELSIISLIFKLDDIKEENFGFVTDMKTQMFFGPFIIDFLAPNSREVEVIVPSYKDSGIRKKFVTGKNIFVTNSSTATSIYSEIISSLDILDYVNSYKKTKSEIEDLKNNVRILEEKQKSKTEKLSSSEERSLCNFKTKLNMKQESVLPKILKELGTVDEQKFKVKKDLNEKLYFGKLALQKFNDRITQTWDKISLTTQKPLVIHHLESDDDIDTKFRGILTLQFQYIKNLMFKNRDDLPILRNRTNTELIGFRSRNNKPRQVEEPINLEYIEDAFEDLDNYCQDIICNYKEIKKLLNTNIEELVPEFLEEPISVK